jgi:carboxyl-terminal processing protease
MKQKLLWLVFAFVTAAQGAALDAGAPYPPELKPAQQQAQAARLAAELLARYHYKRMPLDDALSEKIFDQYLKSLDSEKLFFVQADIDRLAGDRTKLGNAILQEDLSVPFAIFNLYEHRAAERLAYARTLLKKGFDFQKNESYEYTREKEPWPKTEADAREL